MGCEVGKDAKRLGELANATLEGLFCECFQAGTRKNQGGRRMRAKVAKIWLIGSALCLAAVSTAAGRVITVDDDAPADFNNIQAAINDANGAI